MYLSVWSTRPIIHFLFHKNLFYSPSLRAQRTGARKGTPGGILFRAVHVRFQGLHNSLRSDMVQSFVRRGVTVAQFVPEIFRAARGFLMGRVYLSTVCSRLSLIPEWKLYI